jgi:hypothetical protein
MVVFRIAEPEAFAKKDQTFANASGSDGGLIYFRQVS